jgi:hypothetical protein
LVRADRSSRASTRKGSRQRLQQAVETKPVDAQPVVAQVDIEFAACQVQALLG